MRNRIFMKSGITAVLLATSLSAYTAAHTNSGSSEVLTDGEGKSYYTFDKDTAGNGKSSCYGPCALKWPPVPAAASQGEGFGSITRDDNSQQLSYQGAPLYYFVGDQKAGDRNGDGMGGVWHVTRHSAKRAYQSSGGNYGNRDGY